MSIRHLSVILLAGIAALVLPAIAAAEGSRTISGAPMLKFGQLQSGGAHDVDIWRVPLFRGDHITVQAEASGRRIFTLYKPSVNDSSIRNADEGGPNSGTMDVGGLEGGSAVFSLSSLVTGLGSLVACNPYEFGACGEQAADPADKPSGAFSFTATVDHRTYMTVARIKRVVRPMTRQRVTVRVQSPAGTPTGTCHFGIRQIRPAPRVRFLGVARLNNGTCSKRVRTGRYGRSIIRVGYRPGARSRGHGWFAYSPPTGLIDRHVLTLKPKRR